MASKNKEKKKSKKGIIIAIIVLLIFAGAVGGGKSGDAKKEVTKVTEVTEVTETTEEQESAKFFVVSQSEYVRDAQKCILYRVYTDKEGLTEDQLLESYRELIKQMNDEYYLHDIMVYSSEEIADGSSAYDVAEIEEMEKGKAPEVRIKK